MFEVLTEFMTTSDDFPLSYPLFEVVDFSV